MALVISLTISAVLSILIGLVILIWPKALSWGVAIWLIANGILQLLAGSSLA